MKPWVLLAPAALIASTSAWAAPATAPAPAPDAPASASTAPLDPAALKLGREIVTLAFPPERREAMIGQVMASMLAQMKEGMGLEKVTDPELKQILLDYLDGIPELLRPTTVAFIPKQFDAIAQAYARMFPVAQLEDIAAFARTPSGRNFMQRSADILSDPAVAAVNTEYFRQAQAIARQSAAQLQQKMQDYAKAHPDKAQAPSPAR
jgi:hypothetical protein